MDYIEKVTDDEVEALYKGYEASYNILDTKEESLASIKYQAKLEIAMERFLVDGGFGAFTTTF